MSDEEEEEENPYVVTSSCSERDLPCGLVVVVIGPVVIRLVYLMLWSLHLNPISSSRNCSSQSGRPFLRRMWNQ